MSDVWRELEERLKQKAKTLAQIIDMRDSEVHKVASDAYMNPAGISATYNKWMLSKWVRLEDVKEAIQQLKQNYVLVKIGDLEAIVYTSTKYESLRDVVDDFCGNYDDVAREAYALGMKDLAKRLLKE